jgi:hypothetical protein
MNFPHLTSRRRPLTLLDLMVVVLISALPLAAVPLWISSDPAAPVPRPGGPEAAVFMAVLLLAGYGLWWLSELAARGRPRWVVPVALSALVVLTPVYLFMSVLAFLFAPAAASLTLVAQLIAPLYVAFRP